MRVGDQKLMIDLEWPYESRDPGPYFPMKMVTRCPQFGGSLFSYDTGTNANGPGEPFVPDMDGPRGHHGTDYGGRDHR